MEFEISTLPYFGYIFFLYLLFTYTSIPKYIKRVAIIYHRHSKNKIK